MASSRGQVNILESSRCSLMRTPPQRDAVGSRWDQARCVHSRATPRAAYAFGSSHADLSGWAARVSRRAKSFPEEMPLVQLLMLPAFLCLRSIQ